MPWADECAGFHLNRARVAERFRSRARRDQQEVLTHDPRPGIGQGPPSIKLELSGRIERRRAAEGELTAVEAAAGRAVHVDVGEQCQVGPTHEVGRADPIDNARALDGMRAAEITVADRHHATRLEVRNPAAGERTTAPLKRPSDVELAVDPQQATRQFDRPIDLVDGRRIGQSKLAAGDLQVPVDLGLCLDVEYVARHFERFTDHEAVQRQYARTGTNNAEPDRGVVVAVGIAQVGDHDIVETRRHRSDALAVPVGGFAPGDAIPVAGPGDGRQDHPRLERLEAKFAAAA